MAFSVHSWCNPHKVLVPTWETCTLQLVSHAATLCFKGHSAPSSVQIILFPHNFLAKANQFVYNLKSLVTLHSYEATICNMKRYTITSVLKLFCVASSGMD